MPIQSSCPASSVTITAPDGASFMLAMGKKRNTNRLAIGNDAKTFVRNVQLEEGDFRPAASDKRGHKNIKAAKRATGINSGTAAMMEMEGESVSRGPLSKDEMDRMVLAQIHGTHKYAGRAPLSDEGVIIQAMIAPGTYVVHGNLIATRGRIMEGEKTTVSGFRVSGKTSRQVREEARFKAGLTTRKPTVNQIVRPALTEEDVDDFEYDGGTAVLTLERSADSKGTLFSNMPKPDKAFRHPHDNSQVLFWEKGGRAAAAYKLIK